MIKTTGRRLLFFFVVGLLCVSSVASAYILIDSKTTWYNNDWWWGSSFYWCQPVMSGDAVQITSISMYHAKAGTHSRTIYLTVWGKTPVNIATTNLGYKTNTGSFSLGWEEFTFTTPITISQNTLYQIVYRGTGASGGEAHGVGYNYSSTSVGYNLRFRTGMSSNSSWTVKDNKYMLYKIYGTEENVTSYDTSKHSLTTPNRILAGMTINHCANQTTTYGYWIGNVTTTHLSYERNVTIGTTAIPGLFGATDDNCVPGKYYYIRPWIYNTLGFFNSTTESYAMTKPNAPTNLAVVSTNATDIVVSWTNTTIFENGLKTMIRYDTTTYPATPTSGTLAYNGTAHSYKIAGLTGGEVYYISAFSYAYGSGSPTISWYSSDFDYIEANTTGGTYNVSVKWDCNDTYVNLSGLTNTCTFYATNGTEMNVSNPVDADGTFSVSISGTPARATFIYNSTISVSVVITFPNKDITFYIPCGEIGTDAGDISPITIFFDDLTGSLTPENDAVGYIYVYNGTTKEYQYMDFLQADRSIRAYLIIGNTYHIGVACSKFSIPDLRELTIFEDQYRITVIYNFGENPMFHLIFNITGGWTSTDILYLDLTDTSKSGSTGISLMNITLSYGSNGTTIQQTDPGVPWDFNYTKTGLDTTDYYIILLKFTYVGVNGSSTQYNITFNIPAKIQDANGSKGQQINTLVTALLGPSPVSYGGVVVTWAALIGFFVASLFLFTFSQYLSGLAVVATGLSLALLKVQEIGILSDAIISNMTIGTIIMIGFIIILLEYKRD